ncbi:MAG: substrate-binding domain-containing protein [Treponemataceae bacterium]|nr:substrate-binding domain-containing protein [Treponemataceae bacterium]
MSIYKKATFFLIGFSGIGFFFSCTGPSLFQEAPLILATTTSLDQIGLVALLVETYQKQTGVRIHPLPLGSGAALKRGQQKDVDLLLVHAPDQEEVFLQKGYGSFRAPILSTHFIILGPPQDPARVREAPSLEAAFKALSTTGENYGKGLFVSRGDDSGTHIFEKELWAHLRKQPSSSWYLETGQGMAETIAIADNKGLYTLSDTLSWLAYRAKHPSYQLQILYDNPREGITTYSIVVVRQPRHPQREERALQFAHFLISPEGQQIITQYTNEKQDERIPARFPNTGKKENYCSWEIQRGMKF